MQYLRQMKAFRWLVYLLLLPAMVLRETCIGLRTGWDLWCALVQQHEAGWKRRKTAPPLPPATSKTITFRRYTLLNDVLRQA